jgi:hypothetical protein
MNIVGIVKSVGVGTWFVVAAILLAGWMMKPQPPRSASEECRDIAEALGNTAEGQRITNVVKKAYAACLAKKAGSD